jgi:hypothetical protein
MEKEFSKNVVKPGDKGFEYDKRVDFSRQICNAQNDNASWDDDEADPNAAAYDDEDYFDDDFA